MADAIATLVSMFKVKWENEAPSISIMRLDESAFCYNNDEVRDDKPWFYDIKRYLEKQEYPEDATIHDKKTLRKLSAQFFLSCDMLYKRNHDTVLLRCMDRHEGNKIIEEIHEGSFGTHSNGHAMSKRIMRAGYYWMTMETNDHLHARSCHKYQIYADKVHVPPVPLNVLTSPWPFAIWGIDMIRCIEPTASNGHRFIIVDIDYFTKWVEVASYPNVTK